MPLYEYRCATCGARVEVLQRVGSPAPACKACGGGMEKLLSAPALQFKGSGWYVTDYGRGNGRNGDSKPDSAKSQDSAAMKAEAASKTETKSESKPESKSETKPAAKAS